ncbi:hypothetical protein pb186bvf_019921 [Paramecium bursaria]
MAQNRKLKVLTTSQQTIELEVPSDMLISELKQILMQKTQIPLQRQRLFYMGKVVTDQTKLSDIIQQNGQTIHLMPTMENIPQQPSQQQQASNTRAPNQGFQHRQAQSAGNNSEQNQNIFGQVFLITNQQNAIPQQQESQIRNIFGLPLNVFQQQRNSVRPENQQSVFQSQPNQFNIFQGYPGNIFEQSRQYNQQTQTLPNLFEQQIMFPPPLIPMQSIQSRSRTQLFQNQTNQQPQPSSRQQQLREQTFQSTQTQINQFNRMLDQMLHPNDVFPGPPLPLQNTNQIAIMGDLLTQVAFSFQRSIPLMQRTADLLLREPLLVSPEQRRQTQVMVRQAATLFRQMTSLLNIHELLQQVELGQQPGQSIFRNL